MPWLSRSEAAQWDNTPLSFHLESGEFRPPQLWPSVVPAASSQTLRVMGKPAPRHGAYASPSHEAAAARCRVCGRATLCSSGSVFKLKDGLIRLLPLTGCPPGVTSHRGSCTPSWSGFPWSPMCTCVFSRERNDPHPRKRTEAQPALLESSGPGLAHRRRLPNEHTSGEQLSMYRREHQVPVRGE